MWSSIQDHIVEKFRLVNLTSVRAWNSDPYGDLLFDQIWQVIVRAITCDGLHGKITCFVRPGDATVNEEKIAIMSLCVGNLGKLEASGCSFVIILA